MAEVILKPERFSEVSGAKGMGRGHRVYQDVGRASGAIQVLRREKSPMRVCSIYGRGRNHIDVFQRDWLNHYPAKIYNKQHIFQTGRVKPPPGKQDMETALTEHGIVEDNRAGYTMVGVVSCGNQFERGGVPDDNVFPITISKNC